MNPPSNRDYNSVLNFMENDEGQLYEKEMEYIYEKADLVTLRPGREHAWLDGTIESTLKMCRCGLLRVSLHSLSGRIITHTAQQFLFVSEVTPGLTQSPHSSDNSKGIESEDKRQRYSLL